MRADDGKSTVEWDVVRVDLDGDRGWSLTVVECAMNLSPSKKDEDRDKLEVLRQALDGRFQDLVRYRSLFATVKQDAVAYDDASRGYEATLRTPA
jgi:hypothetical protein